MEKCLAKLPFGKENLEKYGELISKYSFALGLFIELTIVILEKSEYIIQYEGLWFRLTFLLFGVSLITTKHGLREWIALFFFGIVGVISYKVSGRNEILRWIVFIWACQGKDRRKVFKFTFWYTLAGCALLFILSLTGLYGTMYLETIFRPEFYGDMESIERRYCFGMGHPNSFHCMMLVVTWLGLYSYGEKIKWQSYLPIMGLHLLVYYFTGSRTGLLMSAGTLGIVFFIKACEKYKKEIVPCLMGMITIVFCVAFSVFMAKHSINHPLLQKIDGFLTGRIYALMNSYKNDGMLSTWFLWSRTVNNNYFDLGIVRFFYWYGIIPGILYFIGQCRLMWCGYKKRDYMMIAILICITVYSVFEAHFVSDYIGRNYVLFFFGMYLSELLGSKKERV